MLRGLARAPRSAEMCCGQVRRQDAFKETMLFTIENLEVKNRSQHGAR